MPCAIPDCGKPTLARGWCSMHYSRWYRFGDPEFTRTLTGVNAHVILWQRRFGPIPKGYVVHHINGDHSDHRLENLQLMTRGEHSRHHITKWKRPCRVEGCDVTTMRGVTRGYCQRHY